MKLKAIFDAITATEEKLLPVFVSNPASQEIAAVAFVAEQTLFSLIEKIHAMPATSAPATATPVAA